MNDTRTQPAGLIQPRLQKSVMLFDDQEFACGAPAAATTEAMQNLYAILLAVEAAQKLVNDEPGRIPELLAFINEQAKESYRLLKTGVPRA